VSEVPEAVEKDLRAAGYRDPRSSRRHAKSPGPFPSSRALAFTSRATSESGLSLRRHRAGGWISCCRMHKKLNRCLHMSIYLSIVRQ
jgi:hypothetical protein